jgi:hypothetical protein
MHHCSDVIRPNSPGPTEQYSGVPSDRGGNYPLSPSFLSRRAVLKSSYTSQPPGSEPIPDDDDDA